MRFSAFIMCMAVFCRLEAQTSAPRGEPANAIAATQSRDPIQLDGRLDESAWAGANVIAELTQQSPRPGELTPYKTTVRVVLAGDKLYFGFDCPDPDPSRIAIRWPWHSIPTVTGEPDITSGSMRPEREPTG